METLWILLVGLSATLVGLSSSLPTTLNKGLIALGETELATHRFHKALAQNDYQKAGEIYAKMKQNMETLEKTLVKASKLESKGSSELEKRFTRLAGVEMKILVEKMGALINKDAQREPEEEEEEEVVKLPPKNGRKKQKKGKKDEYK